MGGVTFSIPWEIVAGGVVIGWVLVLVGWSELDYRGRKRRADRRARARRGFVDHETFLAHRWRRELDVDDERRREAR